MAAVSVSERGNMNITERTQDEFEALTGIYADEEDLVPTRETIADFIAARKSWREVGQIKETTPTLLIVDNAQAVKGQRRGTLAVVDFGEWRVSYFG
jgi:hypothetical protein